MIQRSVLFTSALFIVAGCSSSGTLTTDTNSLEQVNRLLRGREATIHLTDGSHLFGVQLVEVGPEETRYVQKIPQRLATSRIVSISVKGDSGAGIGFVMGVVPGAAIATGSLLDSDAAYRDLGIGLGIAAAFVGGMIGGLLGDSMKTGPDRLVYQGPISRYRP